MCEHYSILRVYGVGGPPVRQSVPYVELHVYVRITRSTVRILSSPYSTVENHGGRFEGHISMIENDCVVTLALLAFMFCTTYPVLQRLSTLMFSEQE